MILQKKKELFQKMKSNPLLVHIPYEKLFKEKPICLRKNSLQTS